jgi:hypothetical protein
VPNLYEAHAILARAQGLHQSVDAVARQTEDRVHAPADDPLYQHVRRGRRHLQTPLPKHGAGRASET